LKKIINFLLILIFIACSSKVEPEKVVDPLTAAIPHGEAMPEIELSEEDKNKLSQAKGRKVKSISLAALKEKMDANNNRMHIYNFWQLDCADCLNMNEMLSQLSQELANPKINIILINLDDATKEMEINTYLRQHNIVNEAYRLNSIPSSDFWSQDLVKTWNGELPATLFNNKQDDIALFYQHGFKYEELMAVVQPLIL
jgi:thiol-disulfide isomerase/thioredoxin